MLTTRLRARLSSLLIILSVALLSGCATTGQSKSDQAGIAPTNPDPLEPMNRKFFSFNETLDDYLMKPVAEGYADVMPHVIRTGVTNFFNNLAYLNVVLNSFLQGKIEDGFTDSFRFIFNSTIGVGGLVDVATPMGFKKHNEDTGQTLAVWGVGQGPYLYLPIFGPDTARNLPNFATSYYLNPLSYVTGIVLLPVVALNVINTRANLLEATNIRDEAAVDKYTFTREAWLQQRKYLIYDGNPPMQGLDDMFNDTSEGGTASPPAKTPAASGAGGK